MVKGYHFGYCSIVSCYYDGDYNATKTRGSKMGGYVDDYRDDQEDYSAADAKRDAWDEKVEASLQEVVNAEFEKRTKDLTDALIVELRAELLDDATQAVKGP